ncbi:nucleoside/nucleotide kinase family protein [Roseomonas elaeocarpi]|uniref:Nucleoside triphosphate hydrolase n=1 Tax=Roseomonas elaeocarpi TaxID=907779 RepID=A0ABV6JZD4_9PROT
MSSPSNTTRPHEAPLIALVGSDGSGKSTVGAALLQWMQEQRPTELCHLGKQTGNMGRAIARWPIIGRRFHRKLTEKADKAREPKGPGTATALVMYLFSMRRVRRFRRMLRLRQQGIAILTDRFPQVEVPGPMDGLSLPSTAAQPPLVRALARRERGHYQWMVSHRPDLVIRLTVDLATAIRRKPDHRERSLATKIADLARLRFNGAKVVDIDATQPLDQVLAQAKQAIGEVLAARPA